MKWLGGLGGLGRGGGELGTYKVGLDFSPPLFIMGRI